MKLFRLVKAVPTPQTEGLLFACAYTLSLHQSLVRTELGQQVVDLLCATTAASDDRMAIAACQVGGKA